MDWSGATAPRSGVLADERTESGLRYLFRPNLGEFQGAIAAREPVTLAELNASSSRITVYPIVPFFEKDRYLEPKYRQILRLSFPIDDIDIDDIWDFSIMADMFPRGFIRDFQYGLGLGKPYLPIIDAVEGNSDCTEIYLTEHRDRAHVDGERFLLSEDAFEAIRIELYRINNRAQAAALRVRRAVARNALATALEIKAVAPGRGRHRLSQVITDSITGSVALTENQQESLLSAAVSESATLEQKRPGSVAKLRNDLELVSLDILIKRFDEAILKKMPESFWQRFFQDNPFALHLAFGYPLIQVQGQASVGGRAFAGSGEKVADFLVRTAGTNNVGIFEIKKPGSGLVASVEYRTGLYAPTSELAAAVTQVLDQRYHLTNSFLARKNASRISDLESYDIRCCVVIGTTPKDLDAQKSFELFRGNSRLVTIVTFDELLIKLKQLRTLLASDDSPSGE